MKMPKKTFKKTAKPLASALTVANPVRSKPGLQPELPKETMAAKGIANPAESTTPPKLTETPAVAEKAQIPTAPEGHKVTFVLLEPDAKQVSLCGYFNDWMSNAAPMKRHDGGHWEATVVLAPGRYEYKFLVDGQWIHDPLAHENVWNRHGTLNSVVEVRA